MTGEDGEFCFLRFLEQRKKKGGGGGRQFCFAYPAGFSSFCNFFFFPKKKRGAPPPAPPLDAPLFKTSRDSLPPMHPLHLPLLYLLTFLTFRFPSPCTVTSPAQLATFHQKKRSKERLVRTIPAHGQRQKIFMKITAASSNLGANVVRDIRGSC